MHDEKKTIAVVGVPYDGGANIRGAALGPSALRSWGLLDKVKELNYNIIDNNINILIQENNIQNIYNINFELKKYISHALNNSYMPLVLGGDHSLALGSISGSAAYAHSIGKKLHLLWVDAHGDFNTPQSSPSGNIHGMVLALLLGQGHELLLSLNNHVLNPQDVTLIAIRDLDKLEKIRILKSGINYYTMQDIDRRGMPAIMDEIIAHVTRKNASLHISFDVDSLDPTIAPGVSTAAPGGLTFREARLLFEMAYTKILSLDFTELNIHNDHNNKTIKICLELIQSALGKTIL
jgi:arginase